MFLHIVGFYAQVRKSLSPIPKEIATPIANLTLTHVRSELIAFQSNKPNRFDNMIIYPHSKGST
jgi:hypothetical protein